MTMILGKKLFVTFLSIFVAVKGAQVDYRGGYSIVVGVDENFNATNSIDQSNYLAKIQLNLQAFSTELWKITNGNFHIKNVDILIPKSWEIEQNTSPAITQSYESSDIKLSETAKLPYTQNPNPCGQAGSFIQLPFDFFDSQNEGMFGSTFKTLITQWARFRYGVWEEHGYPLNSRFPYFYQDESGSQWIPNACVDSPLEGSYVFLNENKTCVVNEKTRPEKECRFEPKGGAQNATTSILSYHFIESITDFCDEETHNKNTPNRQNTFCNYKSAWEVIRESEDFKTVTSPPASLILPKFKIVQETDVNPLYILIDHGKLDNSHTRNIMVELIRTMPAFIESLPENLAASVGVFPNSNGDSLVQERVSWKEVGPNRDAFIEGIGLIPINDFEERDYGFVLKQVGKKLADLNNKKGSVVLFIKTGGQNSFSSSIYEEEVYNDFEKLGVKLFTIEIGDGTESEIKNMMRLTQRTGGVHAPLNNSSNLNINPLLEAVRTAITDQSSSHNLFRTKHKVRPESNSELRIDVSKNSTVYVRVTVPKEIEYKLTINPSTYRFSDPVDEWGIDNKISMILTHPYNSSEATLILKWEYTENVKPYIVVSENFNTPELEAAKIKVSVSTNAVENKVDFASSTLSDLAPFAIYAKVDFEGKAVTNARVVAVLTHSNEKEISYDLYDNGDGFPDVVKSDGTYSAVIIPPRDGEYKINIRVEKQEIAKGSSAKVLPIDQIEIGCGDLGTESCEEKFELGSSISLTYDLESILFENTMSYAPLGKPRRILDFEAFYNENREKDVDFKFTSPFLIGREGKAGSYKIYGAKTQEELRNMDLNNEIFNTTTEIYSTDNVKEPGTLEGFVFTNTNEDLYFAVQSFTSDKKASELSVIARIYPRIKTGDEGDGGDEEKTFFKTAGGIVLIVFIVLAILGVGGGGAFYFYKKKISKSSMNV